MGNIYIYIYIPHSKKENAKLAPWQGAQARIPQQQHVHVPPAPQLSLGALRVDGLSSRHGAGRGTQGAKDAEMPSGHGEKRAPLGKWR